MTRLLSIAAAASIAAALSSPAASPVETARDSIKKAASELLSTQKEYSDLRLGLYREVNKLDDEVLTLTKELRTLERDEELRTSKIRSLERELETRKVDFTYASGVLNQYAKAIVTRIHPAESQLYKQQFESHDQKATASVGDPKSELTERFQILQLGLQRLSEVAGGHRFHGKGLGRGGQAIEGTLLLAGPSVFFASTDKSFEGVASAADTGANLPAIVPLADTKGSIGQAIEKGEGTVPLDATNGRAIEQALKNPEGSHSGAMEHMMLFGDIAKNMMFDGWIAIGICVLMIAVGWTVAARKFFYLNSIQKGTTEFLRQWNLLSSDLTAIDHGDTSSVKSFGGNADSATQTLVQKSPLYQIYHIGSEEIRHRLEQDRIRKKGLSGRSIQAIRAALDAGLVRMNHKLTNGLIYLTISIAGGPYVGLLGTVVGVMITFAIISKVGEVDVNAIAPGIASALLATVAGLVVAIPALFVYSYLNSRIKNITGEMQVFIDEFVAKMAEFYQGTDNANSAAVVSQKE
ncbi:MotA/TolQ/ExbB proton channel family protein [Luteolibacter sp. Populi]|uniref:MotA/TolQ/ExbB proton channel family protein n=1 Tax=Luteolibacter sp. Populi TaxID=3230487 RepID=UPI0034658A30